MPDDMLHPPGPFDGMQCDGDGTVLIGFDVPGVVSKSGFACPPRQTTASPFSFCMAGTNKYHHNWMDEKTIMPRNGLTVKTFRVRESEKKTMPATNISKMAKLVFLDHKHHTRERDIHSTTITFTLIATLQR
jgi:hypothetical protein